MKAFKFRAALPERFAPRMSEHRLTKVTLHAGFSRIITNSNR